MFKKSADLIHLNQRIGSHSTKGRATGEVSLRPLDSTDFFSAASVAGRWAALRLLRRELKLLRQNASDIIDVMASNAAVYEQLAPILEAIDREISSKISRILRLKETIPKGAKIDKLCHLSKDERKARRENKRLAWKEKLKTSRREGRAARKAAKAIARGVLTE